MKRHHYLLIAVTFASSACNLTPAPNLTLPNTGANNGVVSATPTPTTSSTGGSTSGSVSPSPTATPVSGVPTVSASQKLMLDQFISVFENSTTTLQYAYIAAEGDGRGYTAGRAGFTSRDGDMLEVIQFYATMNPSTPLKALIPTLQNLNNKDSGSTAGLSSLPSEWATAAEDPLFRQAQDQISDELYFNPAMVRVQTLNIKTQAGILVMYDAAIEHGVDGVDGVDDMISKMGALTQYKTEVALLDAFQKIRRATLLNPADKSTQAVWSQSVGRVDAIQAVINSGNMELLPPITIDPFGDTFVLTGT